MSHYIRKQEKHLFHAFKSCGVLTQEHVDQYMNKSRLKHFIKSGYIQSALHFHANDEMLLVYFLTSKGKRFAAKYCVSGQFYRSSSATHDIAIANRYMALPLEQRLTWITEKEILNVLNQTLLSWDEQGLFVAADEIRDLIQQQSISPTDGGYICDEQLQLIEVVTHNYTFEQVLAKCLFTQALNCRIEIIKI